MLIISSNVTQETRENLQYDTDNSINLKSKKILLNLGYSNLNENDYLDYLILNKAISIKNIVNKKLMLKILNNYKIKSLKCLDLKDKKDVLKAIFYLLLNRKLVLRDNGYLKIVGLKDFLKYYKKYDYATLKENKVLEYRVIIFDNKIIRVLLKNNIVKSFNLKQDNSRFIELEDYHYNSIKPLLNECLKAVRLFNIDLCGIDVLINDKNEFKIIELNTGIRLCRKSRDLLIREFNRLY